MTENLNQIVEQAYSLFSKYSISNRLDICTACCATPDEEKRLLHTPIRKLSKELIWAYSTAAKPNNPDLNEWKYFLPRFIELTSGFTFPHDILELSISQNGYYKRTDWKDEEWNIIQAWGGILF